GFIPVLVVVGWILMATQPGNGWHEGTVVRWSHDMGLMGLIHNLGLWHGVLAFGFGLVLGTTVDAVPVSMVEPVAAAPTPMPRPMPASERPLVDERPATTRRPWYRRTRTVDEDADAPLAAESRAQQRAAAHDAEPPTVTVGRNVDEE